MTKIILTALAIIAIHATSAQAGSEEFLEKCRLGLFSKNGYSIVIDHIERINATQNQITFFTFGGRGAAFTFQIPQAEEVFLTCLSEYKGKLLKPYK